MLTIFKKIFFKLFPGQNTIKVSARVPTSSGPTPTAIPVPPTSTLTAAPALPTLTLTFTCRTYQIDASYINDEYLIDISYTDCDGNPQTLTQSDQNPFSEIICAEEDSIFINQGGEDYDIGPCLDPAPLPVESVEAPVPPQEVSATEELPVVEVSKPVRARNKGRFVADNKLTDGYNEAWVNGKAPVRKNNKKKKK